MRLVAPDLRGRGDAAGEPGPYGLARHVEDAVARLDAEGLDGAVVAGHSMGAYVTALLCGHPPRPRARRWCWWTVARRCRCPAVPTRTRCWRPRWGRRSSGCRAEFERREAYHDFWRAHPAFAGYDVASRTWWHTRTTTCAASAPRMRSSVAEEAVRTDGRELIADRDVRTALDRMRTPGVLLRAQRGLLDQPDAFIPAAHGRRRSTTRRWRCTRCPTATTSRS